MILILLIVALLVGISALVIAILGYSKHPKTLPTIQSKIITIAPSDLAQAVALANGGNFLSVSTVVPSGATSPSDVTGISVNPGTQCIFVVPWNTPFKSEPVISYGISWGYGFQQATKYLPVTGDVLGPSSSTYIVDQKINFTLGLYASSSIPLELGMSGSNSTISIQVNGIST